MHRVTLPIDLRSAAEARRLLSTALHDQAGVAAERRAASAAAAADAVLMLSELVTNAVRVTRSLLVLEIGFTGETLHVAVVDDGPGLPGSPPTDPLATSGRGLVIVAALADRWGCTAEPGGKAVWFEITLS